MFFFQRKRAAPTAPAFTPQFEAHATLLSDVGCVRELNEDSVRFARPSLPSDANKGVLLVLADGMGGHAAGEVASQKTVEEVPSHYFASDKAPDVALREAVEATNAAIFRAAQADSALRGMGTTCTCLLVRDDLAWCAHVGDSRLYLVRGGAIYQMSEDHSAVGEMVKRGLIRPEEARGHPQGNVILRALGTQPRVEVALWEEPFPLRAGDLWVGCSDGLSDLVEDGEILRTVTQQEAQAAGQSLIELAKSRGGHDNISVALVEIRAVGAGETKSNSPQTREAPVVTREANSL